MDKDYVSIQEMAAKWNMSKRRIQVLCRQGRLKNAKKIGNMWVLPANTAKPADARKKDPLLRTNTEPDNIKAALKAFLKEMYHLAENYTSDIRTQRDLVLGSTACALLLNYISADVGIACQKVANELNLSIEIAPELLSKAKSFVFKYKKHTEVDNILSWAYQYSNKILLCNDYSSTQFFTEQYMIQFLNSHLPDLKHAGKIVDPCCGGGNFLLECLEYICMSPDISKSDIINAAQKLYGYDIDDTIARIALISLKIKVISILYRHKYSLSLSLWNKIKTNIYASEKRNIGGSLDFTKNHRVLNIQENKVEPITTALGNADCVLTNPPFETVKGMNDTLKVFLRNNYPSSSCDTCVAFLYVISHILKKHGVCGIVTQNSWMYLQSFKSFREDFIDTYAIEYILNLGSGAFSDLNGEKTNISLVIIKKEHNPDNELNYYNLADYNYSIKKEKVLGSQLSFQAFLQKELNTPFGFDFSINNKIKELLKRSMPYSKIAIPMQGTSTGNAKKLVDYFWRHFNDTNWRLVSKGGGYCRWQGLNSNVVKWGKNGEFIREQPGSALRNASYFDDTFMVYSDTGTSGLNVRILLSSQLFIASGPGIRVTDGNKYAQIAYLNSRAATYYIRKMSPKLTIAAGYIGKLPVCESIYNSSILEKNAKLCIEFKQKILCTRATNYEYDSSYLLAFSDSLEECALKWFKNDLNDELLKLGIEEQIDTYILEQFHFGIEERSVLTDSVGCCAAQIKDEDPFDPEKMDKYISGLLDESCTLKKTRPPKTVMGCDGILEYTAKDLKINPLFLVRCIENNITSYSRTAQKYKNLILHNEVLEIMGYNTARGIGIRKASIKDISDYINNKYKMDVSDWLYNDFIPLHNTIFKGEPVVIRKEDNILRRDIE